MVFAGYALILSWAALCGWGAIEVQNGMSGPYLLSGGWPGFAGNRAGGGNSSGHQLACRRVGLWGFHAGLSDAGAAGLAIARRVAVTGICGSIACAGRVGRAGRIPGLALRHAPQKFGRDQG